MSCGEAVLHLDHQLNPKAAFPLLAPFSNLLPLGKHGCPRPNSQVEWQLHFVEALVRLGSKLGNPFPGFFDGAQEACNLPAERAVGQYKGGGARSLSIV